MNYSDDNWGQFVNIDEAYDNYDHCDYGEQNYQIGLDGNREYKLQRNPHKFNSYLHKFRVFTWSKTIKYMVCCFIIITCIRLCK